jgi:hypothetical protein
MVNKKMGMNLNSTYLIDEFLTNKQDVFTLDDFSHYLRQNGVKVPKSSLNDILLSSDMVFTLVDNEFVTRAGVFTGRWFSFKPTKEEIDKGYIVLGHRCIPFVNPETAPDQLFVANKKEIIKSESCVFSMNLAMDVFALFGEGYVLPYIFNDHSNTDLHLSSIQYSLPEEIKLTAWPLDKIAGEAGIKYGDRLLCRVINWEENIVEISVLSADKKDSLSVADLEREEWYTAFEKGILESLEKNGPAGSIEEQLAFLFLENQEELCTKNCGSAEEFLRHTKKISFCPYGVETRIWKTGEAVPFVGPWNSGADSSALFSHISMIFSPQIVDAYIEDALHDNDGKKLLKKDIEDIVEKLCPPLLKVPLPEKKLLSINVEKRYELLAKKYNSFADACIVPLRKRIIVLFREVSSLLYEIGNSGLPLQDFPQQELIIIVQLFGHIVRIIEEMENYYIRDHFPLDDVQLSLDGMEETFEDINGILASSLEDNTYKNFTIV